MAAPRVRGQAPRWRPPLSSFLDTDTRRSVHSAGPAPSTSTAHAGPPPRHSIRWCSITWRRSSPRPPKQTPWATASPHGWRRICVRIYDAASSPTGSLEYGARTAATNGYSRSHVNRGASAPHATHAAWPRSPPTSPITCCPTFPSAVAVGTLVAQGPPHRTRRAELPHRAPTLGPGVEPICRPGMLNTSHG